MTTTPLCTCTILSTTSQSNRSLSDSTLVRPSHPDWVQDDSAPAYLFGTYAVRNINDFEPGYCRTPVPVSTRDDFLVVTQERDNNDSQERSYAFWVDEQETQYTLAQKISQTEYDNLDTSPFETLDENIVKVSSFVPGLSTNYGDFLQVTQVIYSDPSLSAQIAELNGDNPQANTIFKYGQCEAVDYGFRCKWQQSKQSNTHDLLNEYTTDLVGSLQGKIAEVRVYITQRRYAFSVTQENGTVTEPIFITANGNPLHVYDQDGGAVAGYGIFDVEAVRLDAQTDSCGDRVIIPENNTDDIQIGITDHDEILEIEGVTCYPMYGADSSNKQTGINGEATNQELVFSLLSSELVTESDLIDGVWQDAKLQTYYVDWSTRTVIAKEPPGYIGQIEINYDNFSAYDAKISVETGMARLKNKNTVLLQKECPKDFGSVECGVNLYAGGHIETLNVTEIIDDYTIVVNSNRTENNYYGVIYWQYQTKTRSLNIASYDGTTKQMVFWQGINRNTLLVGTELTAHRRCDKSESDCKKYQGNVLNHGGAERMPTDADVNKQRSV